MICVHAGSVNGPKLRAKTQAGALPNHEVSLTEKYGSSLVDCEIAKGNKIVAI